MRKSYPRNIVMSYVVFKAIKISKDCAHKILNYTTGMDMETNKCRRLRRFFVWSGRYYLTYIVCITANPVSGLGVELLCVSDVHFPKGFRKYVHLIVGALGVPLSECVYVKSGNTVYKLLHSFKK